MIGWESSERTVYIPTSPPTPSCSASHLPLAQTATETGANVSAVVCGLDLASTENVQGPGASDSPGDRTLES